MAHYDCTNCGARMGIAYGICTSCTPKKVFEKEERKKQLRISAERTWSAKVQKKRLKFIKQYIKKGMKK